MSVDAKGEIAIERTRGEVANIMFDPKYDKVWIGGVTKSFPQAPGKLEKGSRVERHADFLNKTFSTFFDVIRAEEDSFLEMTAEDPFQMKVRYELVDADGGTLVKIRIQSVGEIPFSMPAPILNKAVGDMIGRDLKRLKKLAEEFNAS